MKYFSLPADMNQETINIFDKLNSKYSNSQIIETYGQITISNIWGSGRAGDLIPKVDMRQLSEYVNYSKSKNINFNYTLNATCLSNNEFTRKGSYDLMKFLEKLREAGIELLTIAMPSLIEFVKLSNLDFKIKTSTLCQITNTNKAISFQKMGIDRIVLDESINRDFNTIKMIKDSVNVPLELIVNVICNKNCIYRSFHQNQVSHDSNHDQESVTYYSHRCMMKRADEVGNIMRLNWIRPEDIHHYTDLGINYFKIQGRQAALKGDIVKTVESYMNEYFEGNLMNLLDAFYPTNSFEVNIENRKLDGFIDPFLNGEFCKNNCSDCGYCDTFIKKYLDFNKIKETNELAIRFYNEFDYFKKMINSIKNQINIEKKSKEMIEIIDLDKDFF